jgi:hypothetical protein
LGSNPDADGAVASFAADVILPRVRAMDDNSYMEPEVIQGLFDNGVGCAGCLCSLYCTGSNPGVTIRSMQYDDTAVGRGGSGALRWRRR